MNELNVVTHEELAAFKSEILNDVLAAIEADLPTTKKAAVKPPVTKPAKITWIKTKAVLKLLGISQGTLQNFRENRSIPFSKVGGTLFYDRDKILQTISDNEVKPERHG